jgi:hypothetical protein
MQKKTAHKHREVMVFLLVVILVRLCVIEFKKINTVLQDPHVSNSKNTILAITQFN